MPAMVESLARVARWVVGLGFLASLGFCAATCSTGMGVSVLEIEVRGTLLHATSRRPVVGAWVTVLETPATATPRPDPAESVNVAVSSIAAFSAHVREPDERPMTAEEFRRHLPAGETGPDGTFVFRHSVWDCREMLYVRAFERKRAPMEDEVRALWIRVSPDAAPIVRDLPPAVWGAGPSSNERTLDLGVVLVPEAR